MDDIKIIRVSGCHECPNKFMVLDEYMGCQLIVLGKGGFYLNIEKYIDTKTIPGNCPLENYAIKMFQIAEPVNK